MAQIRCTQKLLKELKVESEAIDSKLLGLGSWHANLLLIDRRKCVLLTNDACLYSIFIPGLKKSEFTHFPEVLGQHLFKNLLQEELPQEQIEIVLNELQNISYTKTNNRSVLGSMNDLAFQVKYQISANGGLDNVNIYEINKDINRTPMSATEQYGIDGLKSLLAT